MSQSGNAALQARREAAVPRGLSTNQPVFAARAENGEIWDVDGKRYIDFASGIAVLATGHRHPKVVAAAKAQLDSFAHVCVQVTPYEPYVKLAERLNALMPGPGPKKSLFLNSGAEAVENAVKIARIATGRSAVVAFNGAFHGRTLLTVALTGKVAPYKLGVAPLPADIYHVPFPDAYHGISVEQSLKAIDALFRSDVDPNRVCAFIVEPVQGEGGFNPAPPEFLQALRKICDRYGILLIADEIQTGFGRTGKLFAVEHSGVAPDMMTVAKSLGGGFPISGVVGKAEIMDHPAVGAVGGTYGGHPMSCAAALAVLDVIEEEGLVERARTIGGIITERLEAMAGKNQFSCIGDIRGLGAMLAVELVKDRVTREPAADLTKALVAKAAENGLMALTCGVFGNAVRFLPALTMPEAQVREGMEILEASLAEVLSA
ncbi:4-aminobutyrate--2-oxoglutarate transaminase [Oleispirillum naphthae]|uniref:4-aminobutyrate--2-oxoglutarate transaminase n=1 Tax=Oleispirillum naphthae TaxID=2838853 RepID=UPI0030825A7E